MLKLKFKKNNVENRTKGPQYIYIFFNLIVQMDCNVQVKVKVRAENGISKLLTFTEYVRTTDFEKDLAW